MTIRDRIEAMVEEAVIGAYGMAIDMALDELEEGIKERAEEYVFENFDAKEYIEENLDEWFDELLNLSRDIDLDFEI